MHEISGSTEKDMEYELIITGAVIVGAMILFATEALRVDLVALCVMVLWVVLGVLTPEQSFQGFANMAVLTVAAMFVLSHALIRAGFIELVAPLVMKLFNRSYRAAVLSMGTGTALFSSFLNNTPIVATFIPIVSEAASKARIPPSQMLIPLSYTAIFGGTCTLIGTSTNLLVAGIAADNGIDTIGMFTITPIGLILFVAGMSYLLLVARKLLPHETAQDPLRQKKKIRTFLTEAEVEDIDEGKEIRLHHLLEDRGLDVEVVQLKRGDSIEQSPDMETGIESGDVLILKGEMDKVKKVVASDHLSIVHSIKNKHFPEEETKIVEAIIMPGGSMVEKQLKNTNFLAKYNSTILAIRQKGRRKYKDLEKVRLHAGDVLLLQTNERGYNLLKDIENDPHAPFITVSESHLQQPDKKKIFLAGGVLAAVILLAALDILPIAVAAWAGVAVLATSRVISMTDAYGAIDWQVIFLLVGSLSFGEAMKESGLSRLLADQLAVAGGLGLGPVMVVGVVYLATNILTETMSNNAAAALMAPMAIAVAESLGVNPTPLLVAVMVAGSCSFMTPIGYQTNTMVYSAGKYVFSDFLRVGTPLNIMALVISSFMIPVIYPL